MPTLLKGFQIAQKVCHFFGIGLELRHRRRVATCDLVNETNAGLPLRDALQTGTHATICLQAMTARTVHLKYGLTLNWVSCK